MVFRVHSGVVKCKRAYIGVANSFGYRSDTLRCKDIRFTNSRSVGMRGGILTCYQLEVTEKLIIYGPTSFYENKDVKILEGPVILSSGYKLSKDAKKKYSRSELERMSFAELRELGRKLRVRGRSREGLINDILAIQEGKKEPEI